ncbi:MAG: 50S ribosomal protein L18 [Bdellovibrio sp.]|nr:MAG: 50S ribosomal protein L18 [Bdellovibrio sp.]
MKNKVRIRKKLSGTSERPRLAVFRSSRHIYAQLIDDTQGKTLVSASTLEIKSGDKKGFSSREAAKTIGEKLAKRALEKNIKNVVFDRSGYVYHGRIRALADGAREAGLQF